jgi:branched-chain amino acid transport system substrate-binding protein
MKHFDAGFIVAVAVASGTVALGHAEVLIGLPAPCTGPNAWMGEGIERGTEMAVADLNAAGGILGQPARLIKVDDYCESGQAVAAANKLVASMSMWSWVINAPAPRSPHPKYMPRPAFS